jgi:NAD(P)H-hydrate epimerase
MKLVSAEQMRELDRRTIEEFEISGEILMDRAGFGVSDAVQRLIDATGLYHPVVHLIAGRGNNGGDAFAAARFLKEDGYLVEVWLAAAANEVKGDALKHLSRMKQAGVTFRELPTKDDWEDAQAFPPHCDILVDGVLGTGSSGPARGPAVGAIQYINARSQNALVVAIDLPSGLDADTGEARGEVVRADLTATMALPKKGLVQPAAREYVGTVEVVDLGIPDELVSTIEPGSQELIYATDLRPCFPRRRRNSHKGDYGRVLIIGGARGYAGAVAMASQAAVSSGAGLVTVLTPESIVPIVAGASLESMVMGGKETRSGSLAPEVWPEWKARLEDFDAVLIGPGLTREESSLTLVQNVLQVCTRPLVLDADAISVLAGHAEQLKKVKAPVLITPHPGEFAALFARPVDEVQKDRSKAACDAAVKTGCTVILKGAGTVVAQAGKPAAINLTGNPGMATGGSGDVLAGVLVALLGQGLAPYDAARAAVYLHGRAGDMVALRRSQAGLTAGDLIRELPYVFRDVTLR